MERPNDNKEISDKELNRKISELAGVVNRILSWTVYLLVRHVPKAEMEGIDAEIEVLKKILKALRKVNTEIEDY